MLFHAIEAARVDSVSEVIVVGDTPLDLQAGANGGMRGMVGVLSRAGHGAAYPPHRQRGCFASAATFQVRRV